MTVTDLPVPKDDTELAEMLADPRRAAPVLQDRETLTNWIKAYAHQTQSDGTDLARQIQEETQRQVAAQLRAYGQPDGPDQVIEASKRLNLTADAKPYKVTGDVTRNAPGRQLDNDFPDWGTYLAQTWTGSVTSDAVNARDRIKRIQNALGSTIPADGGFLIPERLRADLLRVALESSVVRSRARVVPMDSLTVPYPTIDATSNASSVYGGLVGYWTEESGTLTDSSPRFGRVVLQARKLTMYSEIPNELFQDSIVSLEQFMSDTYPEALAYFEDVAFIRGSGVGEPLGFLNADAMVSVLKESGQPANTIVWENIVKMYARMLPGSISRAVWVAHIDTFPELATMALSVGTGGSAIWLSNGVTGPPMTILGRPVIFTEKASTVGTAGDISFVDLGYYLIGDRMQMQTATSTEFKFGTDKTAFRLIQRVDGRPWIASAITPRQGSNTLSPFVRVETRA